MTEGKTKNQGLFTKPELIIGQLELSEGMTIADFGTGHGYFLPYLSKAVGEKGKVYALDVQKSALEAAGSMTSVQRLANIEKIWANLEQSGGSKLSSESLDFVLLKNILFQTKEKVGMLKEVFRVLKNGGMLLLIDWRPEVTREIGPQEGWLIEPNQAKELAEDNGFKIDKEIDLDKYHFGFLFKKNG